MVALWWFQDSPCVSLSKCKGGVDSGEGGGTVQEEVPEDFPDFQIPVSTRVTEQHLPRSYSFCTASQIFSWNSNASTSAFQMFLLKNCFFSALTMEKNSFADSKKKKTISKCDCALIWSEQWQWTTQHRNKHSRWALVKITMQFQYERENANRRFLCCHLQCK